MFQASHGAAELIGAGVAPLPIVGSYDDTVSDENVIDALKALNGRGGAFEVGRRKRSTITKVAGEAEQ